MKTGDTKYYRVKQIKKGGRIAGDLLLIGREYGYIVQLHYFDIPGYKVDKSFDSIAKAENYFDKVYAEEVQK